MLSNKQEQISRYFRSNPRNKIVISTTLFEGITPLDVGKCLSEVIYSFVEDKQLSMKTLSTLEEIFDSAIVNHQLYGKVLMITNIGILFEPILKIDIPKLFERYSNDNALFLHCDGEYENGKLYFLTKKKGIELNLKNLSHLII
ncbi:MAG: hypothetical protein PF484_12730 [Bacteroidales bacterium]|nr:hypothetical protein [Bacteroidales bacterium]